ncbi:MAG: hypothetical protein DHS20C20_03750 [Ardenticatenaceae bacterium]|nr:MAG: hypothetical protein DHS20C20_03750 [Ardenticatenaceae bacterium]
MNALQGILKLQILKQIQFSLFHDFPVDVANFGQTHYLLECISIQKVAEGEKYLSEITSVRV